MCILKLEYFYLNHCKKDLTYTKYLFATWVTFKGYNPQIENPRSREMINVIVKTQDTNDLSLPKEELPYRNNPRTVTPIQLGNA